LTTPQRIHTFLTFLPIENLTWRECVVIDPYAKVNERIGAKRRARGRRDDEYDALIRAASHELGAAAEAALGLFVDVAERVGLRYLEEAARMGATRRFRWTPDAVRAVRFASSRLPAAGGRAVSRSSQFAIETAFSVLRGLRRRLEDTRHSARPGGGDRVPRDAGRRKPTPRSAASETAWSRPVGRRDRPRPERPTDRPEDRRE
jgi:hypothetical protein